MPKWPGLGERIREALLQRGYEKAGRPDILRFALDHRFLPSNVYRWVNANVMPDRENLLRLATVLEVPPAWLLFGEAPPPAPTPSGGPRGPRRRRPVPIRGGSGEPQPRGVVQRLENLPLIGRWAWALAWPMQRLGCPA